MFIRLTTIFFLLLTSACSYHATVQSTSAPASEIRLDRQRQSAVSVVIDDEIQSLNREVNPSTYVCSAHDFPLEIGTALRQSIYDVMDSAYSSVDLVSRGTEATTSNRTYIFSLGSFDPELHFNMGFWSSKASANVNIVLRVTVLNEFGEELARTTIAGDGRAGPMSGGCNDGARVLADAAKNAIEDLLETFVYKVINSDQV